MTASELMGTCDGGAHGQYMSSTKAPQSFPSR
jgi:hypothetical protein